MSSGGISILLEEYFASGYNRGSLSIRLEDRLLSYSHEIRAQGGYWSADVSFGATLGELDQFIQSPIGRILRVYNGAQELVWEGFVNSISISIGGHEISIGPMTEVANRVGVIYTPMDYSVYPPVSGTTTITTLIQNAESQARYGYIEHILSAGQCLKTEAETIAALYLAERKDVDSVGSIGISGTTQAKIQVNLSCLGFYNALGFYVYNNTNTGYTTVSGKIAAVLAANTNYYPRTTGNRIATNSFAIPVLDDEDRQAIDIIEGLTSIGDASNNPYNFGVYKGGFCHYSAIPTTIEYLYHISRDVTGIYDAGSHGYIEPIDVLPGRWLFTVDMLAGRSMPGSIATIRKDPRCRFIDSVRFTAPNSLSITGSDMDRVDIALNRLGLGGML